MVNRIKYEATRDGTVQKNVKEPSFLRDKKQHEVTRKHANRCDFDDCQYQLTEVEKITGNCRCGSVFCAEHRYSDRHDCKFEFKKMVKGHQQKKIQKL